MKKKKVLSQEALATMFGPEKNSGLTAEELAAAADAAAKVIADADAEAEAEAIADELELNAADDSDNDDSGNPELEALQTEFDAFKLATEEADAANEALQLEWEEKTKAVETNAKELKDIVTAQISVMRLGLKMPAVPMTDWDAAAVVTEFNSTQELFMTSYPVGSVIPKDEDTQEPEAVPTSLDASNRKALGF